jgi:uncharacterized protein YerC
LSPLETIVFELRCLQGQPVPRIVDQTGLSPATIYRVQNSVRRKFDTFLRKG